MSFRNAKGGYIRPGYDPLEVANPPTGAGASAGNQSASVSFTAPSNTGGGAITNYYAVSNPGQFTGSSVTSPISVTGLTNGTEYTFKVWGENSYGPSAYSAPTGSVTPVPPFIEDVFSTYLYTGNGSTQTITNGIDLSGEGGLVWFKSRSGAYNHALIDTVRGGGQVLSSNATSAQANYSPQGISAFNSNGFTFGTTTAELNNSSNTYASWTFRKAEKFFDVVTWTGNNASERAISHNLGSVPGCIIVKAYTGSFANLTNWIVYHRSAGTSSGYPQYLKLNSTDAATPSTTVWGSTAFTSTNFYIGADDEINNSNKTYVAYLFAHDAGGFGDSGSDNVISCGSFTTNSTGNATINLGYEPQFLLMKNTTSAWNWFLFDTMRGWDQVGAQYLYPNLSNAETSNTGVGSPTATGFTASGFGNTQTHIYIAIRRGPMKTPTTGTSVFTPVSQSTAATAPRTVTAGFPVDFVLFGDQPTNWGYNWSVQDRLRGGPNVLFTSGTSSENTGSNSKFDSNTAFRDGWVSGGTTGIYEMFRRAPGFFDIVCYTGNGTGSRAVSHNLGATPEMVIVKQRTASGGNRSWWVLTTSGPKLNVMNDNSASDAFGVPANLFGDATYNNYIAPTSTTVTLSPSDEVNSSSNTYVMYLFATLAGVSKVGSYTGTGTTQQINCGFTGGARFVMIKRADSTGDWYVWDSARGIVAGNDPYLLLNSTAAEVTNTDYVDTYSAGFEISSTAPAAINANGGSYIFLAIA